MLSHFLSNTVWAFRERLSYPYISIFTTCSKRVITTKFSKASWEGCSPCERLWACPVWKSELIPCFPCPQWEAVASARAQTYVVPSGLCRVNCYQVLFGFPGLQQVNGSVVSQLLGLKSWELYRSSQIMRRIEKVRRFLIVCNMPKDTGNLWKDR